jgi:hypothetical protein
MRRIMSVVPLAVKWLFATWATLARSLPGFDRAKGGKQRFDEEIPGKVQEVVKSN